MPKRTQKEAVAHWEWPVPKTWVWVRIAEVADIIGGGTPSSTRSDFWEHGSIPWITPADLSGFTGREISKGARNITQTGLENSSAKLLPAKSVMFSSRAPVGYVAIAANSMATNQGFKSFVLSEGIVPEFVYYYLKRAKEEITKLASGTTFPEISTGKCATIPIPIAPTSEQQRIVSKLEGLLSRVWWLSKQLAMATGQRVRIITSFFFLRIRLDAKYTTFARLILGSHRNIDWVEKLWSHL